MVINGMVAGDELGFFRVDDRQYAVPHRVERGFAINTLPIFVFFFREQVLGIGKGRDPAAVLQSRVPADMVAMQVRAHDDVDIVDRYAGSLQRPHPVAVALAVPAWAMRE